MADKPPKNQKPKTRKDGPILFSDLTNEEFMFLYKYEQLSGRDRKKVDRMLDEMLKEKGIDPKSLET